MATRTNMNHSSFQNNNPYSIRNDSLPLLEQELQRLNHFAPNFGQSAPPASNFICPMHPKSENQYKQNMHHQKKHTRTESQQAESMKKDMSNRAAQSSRSKVKMFKTQTITNHSSAAHSSTHSNLAVHDNRQCLGHRRQKTDQKDMAQWNPCKGFKSFEETCLFQVPSNFARRSVSIEKVLGNAKIKSKDVDSNQIVRSLVKNKMVGEDLIELGSLIKAQKSKAARRAISSSPAQTICKKSTRELASRQEKIKGLFDNYSKLMNEKIEVPNKLRSKSHPPRSDYFPINTEMSQIHEPSVDSSQHTPDFEREMITPKTVEKEASDEEPPVVFNADVLLLRAMSERYPSDENAEGSYSSDNSRKRDLKAQMKMDFNPFNNPTMIAKQIITSPEQATSPKHELENYFLPLISKRTFSKRQGVI